MNLEDPEEETGEIPEEEFDDDASTGVNKEVE